MAGLLNIDFNDPQTMGLLTTGLALLGSRGRFGEALGQAGLQGMGAMQQAQQRGMQNKMQGYQLSALQRQEEEAKRQAAEREAMLRAAQSAQIPATPGYGGTADVNAALPPEMRIGALGAVPAKPGGFDQSAFLNQMMSINPLGAIKLRQSMAKETPFGKVDPKDYTQESIAKFAQTQNPGDLVAVRKREFVNNQAVDPYNIEVGKVIPHQANPYSDLLIPGKDGNPVLNDPLAKAKQAIAAAGAARNNVSVNTAQKPFLNEIGKGVGEAVNNAYTGAQSAQQSLANIAQMEAGLKSALVGPGAGVRLKLSQIGQVLGINGADATEQLQNTRNVMQGLARQELAAAGQMKGQGQITESERAILRKAESGDITEMTVPELRTLIAGVRKTAGARIRQHQQNMDRLSKDPNAAGVVDYMKIDAPGMKSIFDQADSILGGK